MKEVYRDGRNLVDPDALSAEQAEDRLEALYDGLRVLPEEECKAAVLRLASEAMRTNRPDVMAVCEQVMLPYGLSLPRATAPLTCPRNENQVREMFVGRLPRLGLTLVDSREQFPDWLLLGPAGNLIRCEVELASSHFAKHYHDPEYCDLIFCWSHDATKVGLPVYEIQRDELFGSSWGNLGGQPGALFVPVKKHGLPRDSPRSSYYLKRLDELRGQGYLKSEAVRVVAEEFGIKEASVWSQESRARRRLRIKE